MNNKIKNIISSILITAFSFIFFVNTTFAVIANPTDVIIDNAVPKAEVVTEGAPKATIVNLDDVNAFQQGLNESTAGSQANGALGSSSGGSITGSAGSAASCLAGSGLSNGIKNYITSKVGGIIDSFTEVPVNEGKLRSKDAGIGVLPSWDSIGYCLANSIIEYIGTATVEWINSGFDGNPVFVENPTQFFSDIADIEAGNFLNDLTGNYLCSPLQAPVRINLANYYNNQISPYSDRASCSFTGGTAALESFISGESFSWDQWINYMEPQNNPMGATMLAEIELDRRIANKFNTESKLLDWGRGFLSFKDPETGKIKSPGSVVEDQINKRLGRGEDRLQVADEFDEIVNALVNQLVKIAISEVTSMGSDSGGGGSNYRENFDDYSEDFNESTTSTSGGGSSGILHLDTDNPYPGICAGLGDFIGPPNKLTTTNISSINWSDVDSKISRHFTIKEMMRNYDGTYSEPPTIPEIRRNVITLAEELDKIYDQWGEIVIIDGYVNQENKKFGQNQDMLFQDFYNKYRDTAEFYNQFGLSVSIIAKDTLKNQELIGFLLKNWSGRVQSTNGTSSIELGINGNSALNGVPSCAHSMNAKPTSPLLDSLGIEYTYGFYKTNYEGILSEFKRFLDNNGRPIQL